MTLTIPDFSHTLHMLNKLTAPEIHDVCIDTMHSSIINGPTEGNTYGGLQELPA